MDDGARQSVAERVMSIITDSERCFEALARRPRLLMSLLSTAAAATSLRRRVDKN